MTTVGSENPRRWNLADGKVGVVLSVDGREGLIMKFGKCSDPCGVPRLISNLLTCLSYIFFSMVRSGEQSDVISIHFIESHLR